MAKTKPSSSRRRELRRSMPRQQQGLSQWVRHTPVRWAVLFAMITALGAQLVNLSASHWPKYHVGQMTHQAIVPRVEFRAVDEFETRRARDDAHDREPAVYRINTTYVNQIKAGLDGLLQIGVEYDNIDQIPASTVKKYSITARTLQELKQYAKDPVQRKVWNEAIKKYMEGIASIALLTEDRKQIEIAPSERAPGIVIIHPSWGPWSRNDTVIHGMSDLSAFRNQVTSHAERYMPPTIRRSAIEVVMLNPQATYLFDKNETILRRQLAYEKEPEVEMTYRPTDVLIPAGATLTTHDIKLLRDELNAFNRELQSTHRLFYLNGQIIGSLGELGALFALSLILWSYIFAYNPRITINPMRGLALTLLLLLCHAVAIAATTLFPEYLLATTIFPTLFAAMVLAIAYDQRFALAIGSLLGLLIMISLEQSIGLVIILLVGVTAVVAQLDGVRNRSKLLVVGTWAGIAMAITTLFVGMIQFSENFAYKIDHTWEAVLIVLGTGFLVGVFVQGILPAIEKIFKVTTSMTLKDLNDASHPLLRQLAQDAPGTYQHSLRIADMAEAAAEAIGGNSLLCRVGAMYHDIGKMNKPAYFVENQGGGPNRHNKLSPAMSLLIIVGHVKDGIEMAREYHLPPSIRQFIETHHGTTLVEYFYHAAKQQQQQKQDLKPAPNEFEFRYPGPKPQNKETAILMLCDCVESAARTLLEPTPVRLEQLVHTMAMKRLMDSQFDKSNITLKDLHKIEEALTKTLCAIYHARISYPAGSSDEKNTKLSSSTSQQRTQAAAS